VLRGPAGVEVPLTVKEPMGVARESEVVSGGIPLPEGACEDPAEFSLFDGDDRIPVQVSPIVKYPDGSLHWALVSFPVKLAAYENKTFTLRHQPGPAPAPANPVVVKEAGSKVTVSNSILAFTIDKDAFNGFENITYAGKTIFKAPDASLVAHGRGGPGTLTHFEYRYKGPVRTTLYLKGTYGDLKAPTWAMGAVEDLDHLGAGNVRGKQVGGELDAADREPERLADGLGNERAPEAGNAGQHGVAVRQNGRQQQMDRAVLPDNDGADFFGDPIVGVATFL
jgi:hypothetical protein